MMDVVIAGGGPAGSVCAGLLAKKGRRVLVLERDHFPRFHLGESLLPQSMHVLDAIGVLDEARDRFQVKRGAQFHDERGRIVRFDFADAFDARYPHAFEVPRDEFDAMLLTRARTLGADVREGWTVTRVHFDGERACGVDATDPERRAHSIEARIVVDATGRNASIAHAGRGTVPVPDLANTAFFSQFSGAWRDEGDRAGDIVIALVEHGWFWFIPFKDGRTSVGAVVKSEWTRANKGSPCAMFDRAVAESSALQKLLVGAKRILEPGAVADFSFLSREVAGDGWLALGDAAGFIDPLFSTGAHVAMVGAFRAADAIDSALAEGDVSRARFEAWKRDMRRGTELFIGAVQAFYGGVLPKYLFADPPHPYLKRAITSMLAGDVFGEARWANDVRTRFAPRLE